MPGGRSPLTELTFAPGRAASTTRWPARGPRSRCSSGCGTGTRSCTRRSPRWRDAGRAAGARRSSSRRFAPRPRGIATCKTSPRRGRASAGAPEVGLAPPWFEHPRFVGGGGRSRACGARRSARGGAGGDAARLHGAQRSRRDGRGVALRVATSTAAARAVARRLGHARWSVAYQSRSGSPRRAVARARRRRRAPPAGGRRRASRVVVAPIGFVCDHVEVLLRPRRRGARRAAGAGLELHRAGGGERPSRVRRDAGRSRPRAYGDRAGLGEVGVRPQA